jgi:hypothetical protein
MIKEKLEKFVDRTEQIIKKQQEKVTGNKSKSTSRHEVRDKLDEPLKDKEIDLDSSTVILLNTLADWYHNEGVYHRTGIKGSKKRDLENSKLLGDKFRETKLRKL